jgi:hypothetical protein
MSEKTFRKVKVLQGRARAEADKQGLTPDDLVLLTTTYTDGLPTYKVEKVYGDPITYILRRART